MDDAPIPEDHFRHALSTIFLCTRDTHAKPTGLVRMHRDILKDWPSTTLYACIERFNEGRYIACSPTIPDPKRWHEQRILRHEYELRGRGMDRCLAFLASNLDPPPMPTFTEHEVTGRGGIVRLGAICQEAGLGSELVWIAPPQRLYKEPEFIVELWDKAAYGRMMTQAFRTYWNAVDSFWRMRPGSDE